MATCMETADLEAKNGSLEVPGAKKARTCDEEVHSSDMMTSKDYYFDSYSHFGTRIECGLIRGCSEACIIYRAILLCSH